MSEYGINIILYPREYNKRGHESLHSVRGVTSDGREINVKLRVPDKYLSLPYVPKISELADVDPRTQRYCMSSPDNSKFNREGVLLFSGAKKESTKRTKIDTYVASWVEVLANSSESADPILGFGRMEVNRSSRKISSIEKELSLYIANRASPDSIKALEDELNNPKNFSYSAIYYDIDAISTFGLKDKSRLKDFIIQAVNKNTSRGRIGGFLIRAIDRNGLIVKSSVREFFPRFSTISIGVNVGKVLFEEKRTELSAILTELDYFQFEIVPLLRVTTGPKSSEYYGEKDRYQKLINIFYQNGEPSICRIISRTTEYSDEGTTLLYRTYPLSVPLGHPGKLSANGLTNLKFREDTDHRQSFELREQDLIERPVGLTCDSSVIKRAYWLLDEILLDTANIIKDAKIHQSDEDSLGKEIYPKTNTEEFDNDEDSSDLDSENIHSGFIDKDLKSIEIQKPREKIETKNKGQADNLTGIAAFLTKRNA